ncbi:MAG: hypothetical protein J6A23_00095 [Thermoguttaceae bacterium]|nr:hypothetical protein [Thermoguttaceae bacterium]
MTTISNTISIAIQADNRQMIRSFNEANSRLRLFSFYADQVHDYINSWTVHAAKWGMIINGAKTALSSMSSVVKASIGQFVEFGNELGKMAIRTNISVENLSRLKYAAEISGSGFEEAVDGIKTFNEPLGAAHLGDVGAIGKLEAVGLRTAVLACTVSNPWRGKDALKVENFPYCSEFKPKVRTATRTEAEAFAKAWSGKK